MDIHGHSLMDFAHLFLENAMNSRCPGESWPLEEVEFLVLIGFVMFCVVLLGLYRLQLPFLGRDMFCFPDCLYCVCSFPSVSITSVISL